MKAYELALDHIEEGILSGRYEVGSILPPERELATQLGIGRSSVREAIRALESRASSTRPWVRGRPPARASPAIRAGR